MHISCKVNCFLIYSPPTPTVGLYVGLYSGSPPCIGPVTPFPMASLPPTSSSCQQDTQRLLGHLAPSEPSHLFRLVLSHRLPRFIASSAIHFKKELENYFTSIFR